MRIIGTLFLGLLLICLAEFSYGQPLSGVYTIGNSPLSSANYKSLKGAVDDLILKGISGPVTFNIESGVYTERISIPLISGVSPTKTITFKAASGNRADVRITATKDTFDTSKPREQWTNDMIFRFMNYHHVIRLDGARYVIIKDLTIVNTNEMFVSGIHLTNKSRSNEIRNCHIILQNVNTRDAVTTSTLPHSAGIMMANKEEAGTGNTGNIFGLGQNADSTKIIGNLIEGGGDYGMFISGSPSYRTTANVIQKNQIWDSKLSPLNLNYSNYNRLTGNFINYIINDRSGLTGYGLTVLNSSNVLLDGNHVEGPMWTGYYIAGNNGVDFINNTLIKTGTAPYVVKPSDLILFSGEWTAAGVFVNQTSFIRIIHNSLLVDNLVVPPDGNNTEPYKVTAANLQIYTNYPGIVVSNNIMANIGKGLTYYITSGGTNGIQESQNNDLWTNGNYIAKVGNTLYYTLTEFQTFTGLEKNSVSVNPQFLSPTNLHTRNPQLDGKAKPFSWVNRDMDGDPRNPEKPDIGADEFELNAVDIAVVDLTAALVGPGFQDAEIQGQLKNLGSDSLKGKNIQLQYSADSGASWFPVESYTVTGLKEAYTTEWYKFTRLYTPLQRTSNFCVRVNPSSIPGDAIPANNTFCKKICLPVKKQPVVQNKSGKTEFCGEEKVTLYVGSHQGTAVWQTSKDSATWSTTLTGKDTLEWTVTEKIHVRARIQYVDCGAPDTSNVLTLNIITQALDKIQIRTDRDSLCKGEEAKVFVDTLIPYAKQWQQSPDSNLFVDIPGETGDTLKFTLDNSVWIRVRTTNAPCTEVISNPKRLVLRNTGGEKIVIQALSDSVCPGAEAVIVKKTLGGDPIQWQDSKDGNNFSQIPGQTKDTLRIKVQESTWFRLISPHPICDQPYSNSVKIWMKPLPKALFDLPADSVFEGKPLTFTANNSLNAKQHQWSFGDGTPNSNLKNPTHTFDSAGQYLIVLRVTNDCGTDSMSHMLTVYKKKGSTSGVATHRIGSGIHWYPNPTHGTLTIEVEWAGAQRYELTDPAGTLVGSGVILDKSTVLDLSGQVAGVYLLRIGNQVGKVIKY